MRKEFVRILNALEIDHISEPDIESIREMTFTNCADLQKAINWYSKLVISYQSFGHSPKFHATCTLCKAITGSVLEDLDFFPFSGSENKILFDAITAMEGFRSCGNAHNEGISHWLLGVAHRTQTGDLNTSLSEFHIAIGKFKTCSRSTVDESNFSCSITCRAIIALMCWSLALSYQALGSVEHYLQESQVTLKDMELCIKDFTDPHYFHAANRNEDPKMKAFIEDLKDCAKEIQVKITAVLNSLSAVPPAGSKLSEAAPAASQKSPAVNQYRGFSSMETTGEPILIYDPQLKFLWQTSWLSAGVFDFAHASRAGKFIFDDSVVSTMTYEDIKFEEIPHKIFHLRGGRRINLNPKNENRWIKVAGDSMDRASPIPIEDGDYILVVLNIAYEIGNVIIAKLINPPTPEERAGVVKLYEMDGLKSLSTREIDPIPLDEVEICGVVIAVAKPIPGNPDLSTI